MRAYRAFKALKALKCTDADVCTESPESQKDSAASSRLRNFLHSLCEPYLKASAYERCQWAVLVCVFSAACVGAQYLFYRSWSIGIDNQIYRCIDARVYVVSKTDRIPVRDEIFAIVSKGAAPAIPDGELMAKYIRGLPGDKVTITEDAKIYVNGKLMGEGLYHLRDASEEERRKFIGSRVLKDDEYWVMGTLPRSFDSRYYGPVRGWQIKGRVYAAF